MKHWPKILLMLALLSQAQPVLACAVCYGKSDSALAQGMNWGIFSLLFVTLSVLGTIGGFFIFLARRSKAMPGALSSGNSTST